MCNCNVLIIATAVAFYCWRFFPSACEAGVWSFLHTHNYFLFIPFCLSSFCWVLSARWQCNLWLLIARTTAVDDSWHIWETGTGVACSVTQQRQQRQRYHCQWNESRALIGLLGSLIKNHTLSIHIEWWEISFDIILLFCVACTAQWKSARPTVWTHTNLTLTNLCDDGRMKWNGKNEE